MVANQEAIARIDSVRARSLARMMVTKATTYDDQPMLLDLSQQNPAEMLAAYAKKMASYATSPIDPRGDKLRFYDGGYTIWSGYPGTGKTTLLRQLQCHLLHVKLGVFGATLEEDPRDSLIRVAGVAFGTAIPTQQQLQWFLDYYADQFRVWGMIGLARYRDLFGMIQDLAAKGTKQFVIDSLMCLDVPSDDFERQRVFANELSALVRATQTHVHLVAHPRKVVSSDQEPDQNDVAGSADLGRLADSIVFVRKGPPAQMSDELTAMQVKVKKQRHDPAFTGDVVGWFNRRIRQFVPDQFTTHPTQYLPKQAYES